MSAHVLLFCYGDYYERLLCTYTDTQTLHRDDGQGGQERGDDADDECGRYHGEADALQEVVAKCASLWKLGEKT